MLCVSILLGLCIDSKLEQESIFCEKRLIIALWVGSIGVLWAWPFVGLLVAAQGLLLFIRAVIARRFVLNMSWIGALLFILSRSIAHLVAAVAFVAVSFFFFLYLIIFSIPISEGKRSNFFFPFFYHLTLMRISTSLTFFFMVLIYFIHGHRVQ